MKTEEVANLPITNDFMFARIMSDQTICKALLETILHLHIKEIHYLETQKTMNINVDTHGIRLDIYVEDDKQVYNVECQTTNNRNLATRCRYYQSNIDMDLLKKGDDYYTLKKSFIIFICTFDPFKLGFYQYTFKNFCQEDKTLPLDDGTAKIFLNTEGKTGAIGEDLIQILNYFETRKPNTNPLVKTMEKAVQLANKDTKWRRDVMTFETRMIDKYHEGEQSGMIKGEKRGMLKGRLEGEQSGLLKGEQRGLLKGKFEVAKKMLTDGYPIPMIAQITSLDEEEIRKILKSL